jgi:hypothetical protein
MLAIVPFFWHGNPSGHDFEVHVFSWMNVARQWRQGVLFPCWADLAYWGYGEPTFLFYPPGSWVLGGILGSVLPWIGMYEAAKRWLTPPEAFFAAVFYAANPYFLIVIYWRSAFAELLTACMFPLLLLVMTRLEEPGFPASLALSLVFATAWLINVPASVMIHYSAAGLALVGAMQAKCLRPLVKLAAGMLLGAALASFYLVPAIYEQRWVNIDQVLSPGVRPQDNYLFTLTTDPDHNHFNSLVSLVGAAEICAFALALFLSCRDRAKSPRFRLLWVWGMGATLFTFSFSRVFWEYLPKFRFVQLPFRWLLCLNVVLALLLPTAVKGAKPGAWVIRGLTVILLFGVLFFGGRLTQPPWWDTAADIEEMRQFVLEGTGYEGVDEYVPTGADTENIKKELPRLSDETGSAVSANVIEWRPTVKHFRLFAAKPFDLTMRLFSYPAWKGVINGRAVELKSSDQGLIVVPVGAGGNDVQITFGRTLDRTVGATISVFAIAIIVGAWVWTRARRQT